MDESRGHDFDQKLYLWNQIIELPDQEYFDKHIFKLPHFENPEKRKREKAEVAFLEYEELADDILEILENFENTFKAQLEYFKTQFPSVDLSNTTIRPMVSLKSFVGMSDTNPDGSQWFSLSADFLASLKKHPAQVKGLDFIFKDRLLYMHEIFHLHQNNEYKQNENLDSPRLKLIAQFWSEGLAVYFSQIATPGSSNVDALGVRNVQEGYEEKTKKIHEALLDDLKNINDENYAKLNSNWWALNPHPLGFPTMIGYALARELIANLHKKKSFVEMLELNIHEFEKILLDFIS